jgi:hypothetical protein
VFPRAKRRRTFLVWTKQREEPVGTWPVSVFKFTGSVAARAAETTSGPVHDGNRPKNYKTHSREVIRRPVWRPDARLLPPCPRSKTLRPTHAVHRGEPIQHVPVACREVSRSPCSPLHASPKAVWWSRGVGRPTRPGSKVRTTSAPAGVLFPKRPLGKRGIRQGLAARVHSAATTDLTLYLLSTYTLVGRSPNVVGSPSSVTLASAVIHAAVL